MRGKKARLEEPAFPIRQNCIYFFTNDAISKSLGIQNILNLCYTAYFMTFFITKNMVASLKAPQYLTKGSHKKKSAEPPLKLL